MIRGGFWGGAWGLSWGGAWGEAWLLLNQPYQELSLKGQVFVRSYLTRIHSVEVAEQIVSVAAVNNISVIDAEVALSVIRKTVNRKLSDAAEMAMPSNDTQDDDVISTHRTPVITATVRQARLEAASAQGGFSVKSFMSK